MFTSFNAGANANVSTTNATDAVSGQAPASETSNMFTKLLVAQIKNQDPLSPSDPSQFVNQLSQLSQTEALQKLAQVNSASASSLQALQVLSLGGQVGASVSVAADSVALDQATVSGNLTLASGSAATSIVLTGADGQQHELALGSHKAGSVPFTIDPAALGLAPGVYTLQASTAEGSAPTVEVTGRVERVRMAADGSVGVLVAGIGEVSPSSITSFNGKTAP